MDYILFASTFVVTLRVTAEFPPETTQENLPNSKIPAITSLRWQQAWLACSRYFTFNWRSASANYVTPGFLNDSIDWLSTWTLKRKDRLWQLFEGHEDLCRKLPYRLWPKQARETPSLFWFSEANLEMEQEFLLSHETFSKTSTESFWAPTLLACFEGIYLTLGESAHFYSTNQWLPPLCFAKKATDDETRTFVMTTVRFTRSVEHLFVWWVCHHVLLCKFLRSILRELPVCQNVL